MSQTPNFIKFYFNRDGMEFTVRMFYDERVERVVCVLEDEPSISGVFPGCNSMEYLDFAMAHDLREIRVTKCNGANLKIIIHIAIDMFKFLDLSKEEQDDYRSKTGGSCFVVHLTENGIDDYIRQKLTPPDDSDDEEDEDTEVCHMFGDTDEEDSD